MRYITGLGTAVLALAIAGPWAACSAQAPSGSYQQTCRDIGVRGSTLYARCKDTNNEWRDTQLQDYGRCRGEIQNLNGSLQCTGDNGGYADHDRDRDRDHDHDADHDRDRDHDHDADHDRDRDHDNDRDRDRYNNGIPRGSYAQTCQNVTIAGNTLRASCQKKNGKWKNTSLNNYNRCNG
ncbi:MAG TPA: hypothetical protein VJW20_13945, partial [Candidatus Angelobacter sp.]|nr:hypothetical protein [Candidatus Angelobacter sp.]